MEQQGTCRVREVFSQECGGENGSMGAGGEGQGNGQTYPFHSGFLEVTPSPFRDLFLFCFTDQLSLSIPLRKDILKSGVHKKPISSLGSTG